MSKFTSRFNRQSPPLRRLAPPIARCDGREAAGRSRPPRAAIARGGIARARCARPRRLGVRSMLAKTGLERTRDQSLDGIGIGWSSPCRSASVRSSRWIAIANCNDCSALSNSENAVAADGLDPTAVVGEQRSHQSDRLGHPLAGALLVAGHQTPVAMHVANRIAEVSGEARWPRRAYRGCWTEELQRLSQNASCVRAVSKRQGIRPPAVGHATAATDWRRPPCHDALKPACLAQNRPWSPPCRSRRPDAAPCSGCAGAALSGAGRGPRGRDESAPRPRQHPAHARAP